MTSDFDRRDFLRLAGIGGAVFASALAKPGLAAAATPPAEDFFFVQLTDTHWGYEGGANPESKTTLKRAVAAVNALHKRPDFVVFTGDLTHTTESKSVRRDRMNAFRDIVSGLNVKDVRFMPGEHDASLDKGEAFLDLFGPTYFSYEHKGVHFVAIDNVSDPTGAIGPDQMAWLKQDLARVPKTTPVVVLTHRPLFELVAEWNWTTSDGAQAIELLSAHPNVTVFYGHIHQEHHHMTGHIAHHAGTSLIFPLPAPGSVPKPSPVAWNAEKPFSGLGWRGIDTRHKGKEYVYVLEQKGVTA